MQFGGCSHEQSRSWCNCPVSKEWYQRATTFEEVITFKWYIWLWSNWKSISKRAFFTAEVEIFSAFFPLHPHFVLFCPDQFVQTKSFNPSKSYKSCDLCICKALSLDYQIWNFGRQKLAWFCVVFPWSGNGKRAMSDYVLMQKKIFPICWGLLWPLGTFLVVIIILQSRQLQWKHFVDLAASIWTLMFSVWRIYSFPTHTKKQEYSAFPINFSIKI